MKDKVLLFLKSKLTGVPESFLAGIADLYGKTITKEEEIATTLTDPVLDLIKLSASQLQVEGDRRATEAQKTVLKNYMDKHDLDENGKSKKKEKTEETDDELKMPSWAKTLMEKFERENNEVKSKLQEIEQAKTQEVLMGKMKTSLKEKGIPEWFANPMLRNLKIESEDNLNQLITGIETDFSVAKQASAEQGVVISVPPKSDGASAEGADLGKRLAEKKNAEQLGESGKLKK